MAMRRSAVIFKLRFLLGLAAIGSWSLLLLRMGAAADRVHPLLAGLAGSVFAVSASSLGEWLVHGVIYHGAVPGLGGIRRIHHHGHHFALFPPHRYAKRGGYEFMQLRPPLTPFRMANNRFDNLYTELSQVALHLAAGIPLIVVPAWLLAQSPAFLGGAVATLVVISWLLAHVHGAIHTPRDRWIERRWWFRWLDRHHYIHHIDLSANVNFMLPLCDFLFGTRKAYLSERERHLYPSYQEASGPRLAGARARPAPPLLVE